MRYYVGLRGSQLYCCRTIFSHYIHFHNWEEKNARCYRGNVHTSASLRWCNAPVWRWLTFLFEVVGNFDFLKLGETFHPILVIHWASLASKEASSRKCSRSNRNFNLTPSSITSHRRGCNTERTMNCGSDFLRSFPFPNATRSLSLVRVSRNFHSCATLSHITLPIFWGIDHRDPLRRPFNTGGVDGGVDGPPITCFPPLFFPRQCRIRNYRST